MKRFWYFVFFPTVLYAFQTDVVSTLASARKEKKPLIISFYGIWCPPCNQLEETVFESATFLQKAKSFKLLKVDADDKKSWKIKDTYKIGGYPTIIFADYSGKEIYRIVGYRTLANFISIMDTVLTVKDVPLEKACASKKTDDLWRCARICTERNDEKCAKESYAKLENLLSPPDYRYEEARAYAIASNKNQELKRDGYARLITEFPKSPRALEWAIEYLDLFEKGSKPVPNTLIVDQVLSHFGVMLSDPTATMSGYSETELLEMRATLLEKLGKGEEAKKVWKEAAMVFEKLTTQLPKGSKARGFTLERIGCLSQAGEKGTALALSNQYREMFPNEFTFHYKSALILQQQKKYTEALPIAKKAFEVSYGDNRIRVATLLINLLATVPDKEAAKKIYEEVTREIKPASTLDIRTHKYLKSLEDAWKGA